MNQNSYNFTGDKADVLSELRKEFDEYAYPYFDEVEKAIVGSKADGEYHYHFNAPSGLDYNGIVDLHGYDVRWFFSVSFSYASDIDEHDKGRCFALFYVNDLVVLTYHSLWRYNERVLGNAECKDADIIFHMHIERMMDYASFTKSQHSSGPSLFVRVDGGAFLSDVMLKEYHWCKTFISDNLMYKSQRLLSGCIDAIDEFESASGIRLSSITEDDYAERVDTWIGGNRDRKNEYSRILHDVQTVYMYYSDDELTTPERNALHLIGAEITRIKDS